VSREFVASFFTLTGNGFGEPPRHGFAARCRAAADAGFAGIGVHVDDADREGLPQMRAVLADTGLRVVEIEFITGWATGAETSEMERRVYRLAEVLGGRHVSIGQFAPGSNLDVFLAAKRLTAMARRAADHGLLLAVEPFAWSPIRDVRTALELLDAADAPNAGLLVDVWHFFNGGATLDQLRRVAAVQLNNGPRVSDDFLRLARATRWLPGRGELDAAGLVRRLEAIGYDGPYCVEVNYPEFRSKPVAEAARAAYDDSAELVRTATA
jgi:sugar phosphate isomerase/epimerase